MSGGVICKCSEANEPLTVRPGSNRPARLWRVTDRLANHSAFNGGHYTSSDYSAITCLRCGAMWRTKADYVSQLSDRAGHEHDIHSGTEFHRAAMRQLGREVHPTHAYD